MAAAIISGLVSKGFDKQKIHVSEPWDVNRNKMADLGVKTTTSNLEAASGADVLIIAVKPQVAKTVCQELAGSDAWSGGKALPLLVSIAAGITSDSLRKWSTTPGGAAPPVVRVMPNTPALVGEGASGLYAAGDDVSAEQRELVTALMSSVSKATEWVDREELLDVVTGLSGKQETTRH
jgi:pyrroline-5-carboxylate reductase